MWVRGAAIRPVPAFARVDRFILDHLESELAEDTTDSRIDLDEWFRRFETTQPELAARASDVLNRPLDETALALGYFLTVVVWRAFERSFGARLTTVTSDGLRAAEEAIELEEELRRQHGDEPLDLDDVVAIEQPGVLAFVNEHVDAALDAGDDDGGEVDVDDVHIIYRLVLLLVLSLSHSVAPSGERPVEIMA